MNTARKIVKNSGAALIIRISNPLTAFVFIYFIAKYLGVTGVGVYSSALSLLIIFQAFACLGYEHLITKEVAQDNSKAGKFLVNATLIGIFFSIIIAGIMCAIVNLITNNVTLISSVYVLSVSLIPYVLGLVCKSISVGFEKLEDVSKAIVLGNALKLIFGFIVLYKGYGLLCLMIVISGSYFCIAFIQLYLTLKSISKPLPNFLKIDFVFCKWILKKTPAFALIFIVATIRMYINIPLLNSLMGERDVGFYDAAYRLVNICSLGIGFYFIAIRPTIFRLYKSSMDKFEFICTESIRYFFIIILPIIVGITILSDKFILIIFQPEFLPSAFALKILVWILLLNGFNQIIASALISSDNQKVNLKANILGMISNIALCFVLIPKFSFTGAAISNIAATITTFFYQYVVSSKHLFKIGFIQLAKKPLAASVLLGGFIFLLKDIHLFMLLPLSVVVYTILLFAIRVFSVRDIKVLHKLWFGEEDLSTLNSTM